MSFVMTVYVREGIVMAADSRLTLTTEEKKGESATVKLAVGLSDSNYKLFTTPCGIGISTYGAADIRGVPIAGYVDSFISAELGDGRDSVEAAAWKLARHFGSFDPRPATYFHVAGYAGGDAPDQEVWQVDVATQEVRRISESGQQGACWGGETDILVRLVQPVAQVDQNGAVQAQLPQFPIPWQFFTLQDAIDFAVFAMRSTIEAIRFQPRAKTVGGPIDVLVIKPTGATWVQRKELHIER
jgi:hypothetical protein